MQRNIKLIIEYDGTNYSGWQKQPNANTVQAEVTNAIHKMTREPITLYGSSRTDAGVHALAYVANFTTRSKIECFSFLRGLNTILPYDISIKEVVEVDNDFHAKRSARSKHYRYILALGASKPALLRDRAWFVNFIKKGGEAAFVRQLNAAARVLIGDQDFTSFCASGDTNVSKRRRLLKISARLIRSSEFSSEPIVHIDVFGEGFLKQMVRNIVGTLVDMVKLHGKSSPAHVRSILLAKDRKKAGVTAPACGLALVEVKY